jgi:hypothetical protein
MNKIILRVPLHDKDEKHPILDAINACKEALEVANCDLKQPAQEPMAYFDHLSGLQILGNIPEEGAYLYVHPHKWQGLTDNEIYDIIDNVFSKSAIEKNGVKTCSVHEGFRAIEQALKDKNT